MKTLFLLLFALFVQLTFAQTGETFHDFNAVTIRGDTISLSQYTGKKVMVVNTASYCGFTPQYADLQALYQQYGGPTFEIIGFPCNDFGGQEPGTNGSIDSFCTGNYYISFQMMSRVSIAAPDTVEVYKWLQNASRNCFADAAVAWNFNKYLIDEAGNWIAYYPSAVNPLDPAIVNWILSPNTTGIVETKDKLSASLISNPVSNFIAIQLSGEQASSCKIQLFDTKGNCVYVQPCQFNGSRQTFSIPVQDFQNGVYFLKITESGNSQQVLRVVVLH